MLYKVKYQRVANYSVDTKYFFTSLSPSSNGMSYPPTTTIICGKTCTVAAFAALRHYSEKLCHGVHNLGFYSG